jgi:excisionase family DNA binding protein
MNLQSKLKSEQAGIVLDQTVPVAAVPPALDITCSATANHFAARLPQMVFTAEEVAEILKVSNKTVYRLVDRNLLRASKALRHLRITKKSLDEFMFSTSGEEAGRE